MEHDSAWLADARIPARPPLAGDLHADVVVIGGGITGLTAALMAQRDGADVVVLEGDRLAGGSTGHSTGKVTSQHTMWAASTIERHGERLARQYAEANQHAVELVARLVDELAVDCQFERAPACAWTGDPDTRADVEREAEASVRLGMPAEYVDTLPLPVPVVGAVRFSDQVQLNPAMYVAGLADAVETGGGRVFEHSRVTDVDDRGDHVVAKTAGGSVTAGHAVVATLLPIVDLGGFFAKAAPSRSYGIAVRLSEPPPEGMYISVDSPTRSLRPWRGVEHGMVVVGESHETGHSDHLQRHYEALDQWTRAHFPVLEVRHRWSAQDYKTVDELPYVGRCPRTERVYVATGMRKWGLSNGTAAGAMIADLLAGRDVPWLEAFDATRVISHDAKGVEQAVRQNVHVGKRFVKDRAARLRADALAELEPGEGRVVRDGDTTVAAYRDEHGAVHAVSPTCTHLGCTVHFNDAERSWDCPCHGSRFALDGTVLNGPAVTPLQAYEMES